MRKNIELKLFLKNLWYVVSVFLEKCLDAVSVSASKKMFISFSFFMFVILKLLKLFNFI